MQTKTKHRWIRVGATLCAIACFGIGAHLIFNQETLTTLQEQWAPQSISSEKDKTVTVQQNKDIESTYPKYSHPNGNLYYQHQPTQHPEYVDKNQTDTHNRPTLITTRWKKSDTTLSALDTTSIQYSDFVSEVNLFGVSFGVTDYCLQEGLQPYFDTLYSYFQENEYDIHFIVTLEYDNENSKVPTFIKIDTTVLADTPFNETITFYNYQPNVEINRETGQVPTYE